MLSAIQSKLKPSGMHHGWQVIAAIGISLLWSDGVVMAYCGGVYFIGREVREAQGRKWSNNPLVIAKNIEWRDFVTPCLISAVYIGGAQWVFQS